MAKFRYKWASDGLLAPNTVRQMYSDPDIAKIDNNSELKAEDLLTDQGTLKTGENIRELFTRHNILEKAVLFNCSENAVNALFYAAAIRAGLQADQLSMSH